MAKPFLLVISSAESNRAIIQTALKKDYDLDSAESGEEALQKIRKKKPAAVVMDHSIEDFMTNAFIDKVRNSPATRSLPFVIVSRETTNSFVEQGVRSGVSHYIGIPFEEAALKERIRSALTSSVPSASRIYFRLPTDFETSIVSFGRLSFLTPEMVHFETNLNLQVGQKIMISGPLFDSMQLEQVELEVGAVSQDVYYNYPWAIDAKWADPAIATRMKGWVPMHKNLNSPKKKKVLIVESDPVVIDRLIKNLDQSRYSLRMVSDLKEAVESFPFMKPAGFVVSFKAWSKAGTLGDKMISMMTESKTQWILQSDAAEDLPTSSLKPALAPENPDALSAAIRNLVPPAEVDPNALYLSKTLDYSRCNFFLTGKVLAVSEMGVKLALSLDISLPCNLQLGLKALSEQKLRNPFVRAWPPLEKMKGDLKCATETHFLGINEQQSQAIRQWLYDEQLKDKKEANYQAPRIEKQGPDKKDKSD